MLTSSKAGPEQCRRSQSNTRCSGCQCLCRPEESRAGQPSRARGQVQDELLRIVEERLAADEVDKYDWSLYVLAACEGEAALNDLLGGAAAVRSREAAAARATEHE